MHAELSRSPFARDLRPPLRHAYENECGAARREELTAVTVTGLLLYLPAILSLNVLSQGAPSWITVAVQVSLTPLVALLVAQWAFHRRQAAASREWGAAAVAACVSVSAVAAVADSPADTAALNFFLAGVPVLSVLALARLRFTPALGFLFLSMLAFSTAISLRADLPLPLRAYPLCFLVMMAAPILGAIYRQDCAVRLTYLRDKQSALRIQALTSENLRLNALSATDAVTGAANRRHLENVLATMCGADGQGDFLLLADIDFFKRFNDRHGHLSGDACLRLATETMRRQIRRGDLLARYGGEEFAIVLSRTNREDALATAERIRADVERQDVLVNGTIETITISIGLAERQRGDTAAMLIAAADIALYQAKRSGRNCVRESRIALPVLT